MRNQDNIQVLIQDYLKRTGSILIGLQWTEQETSKWSQHWVNNQYQRKQMMIWYTETIARISLPNLVQVGLQSIRALTESIISNLEMLIWERVVGSVIHKHSTIAQNWERTMNMMKTTTPQVLHIFQMEAANHLGSSHNLPNHLKRTHSQMTSSHPRIDNQTISHSRRIEDLGNQLSRERNLRLSEWGTWNTNPWTRKMWRDISKHLGRMLYWMQISFNSARKSKCSMRMRIMSLSVLSNPISQHNESSSGN